MAPLRHQRRLVSPSLRCGSLAAPRDPLPLAVLLLVGCLVAGLALVWAIRTTPLASASSDDPGLVERPVATLAPATTVPQSTAPATPPSTAPADTPVLLPPIGAPTPAPGPVEPPDDRRAKEPRKHLGTIEIPRIGLTHEVYEGIRLTTIDRGPSHWPGTALPGRSGNTVFAGHRVTHSHPFRRIDELERGDRVVFTVQGERSEYMVTEHLVVRPGDLWIVDQTPEATGTLFACHPPGSARYRYVVRLVLVSTGAAV